MGALDDNGVISIHGYMINRTTGLLLALGVSLSVYLAVIRMDKTGELKTARHPALLNAPAIVSCLGCFLPLVIYIMYSLLLSLGPKGTKAAIR